MKSVFWFDVLICVDMMVVHASSLESRMAMSPNHAAALVAGTPLLDARSTDSPTESGDAPHPATLISANPATTGRTVVNFFIEAPCCVGWFRSVSCTQQATGHSHESEA